MKAVIFPATLIACFVLLLDSTWAQENSPAIAQENANAPQRPTITTIVHGSASVQDCKKNMGCLIKAFNAGKPAMVRQKLTIELFDMKNISQVYLETSNFTPETVTYYVKWEKLDLKFTRDWRRHVLEKGTAKNQLNEKKKKAVAMHKSNQGADGACIFQRAVFREFLGRWSKAGLSIEDYRKSQACEGMVRVGVPPLGAPGVS